MGESESPEGGGSVFSYNSRRGGGPFFLNNSRKGFSQERGGVARVCAGNGQGGGEFFVQRRNPHQGLALAQNSVSSLFRMGKTFQELFSEKVLILLRDRPCLEVIIVCGNFQALLLLQDKRLESV